MLVRLTDHVMQGNNVKTTFKPNRDLLVAWVRGAVIEMSEASAKKFIDKGKAEELTEEEEAAEREKMAEDAEARRVVRENRLAGEQDLINSARRILDEQNAKSDDHDETDADLADRLERQRGSM